MPKPAQSFSRLERVNEMLQQALAPLVQRHVSMQDVGLITIAEVDTSPDLSTAKIFFTVMQEDQQEVALQRLQDAASELRRLLSKQVNLRRVPKLNFIYDATTASAHRMDRLINTAISKEQKKL